MSRLIDKLTKSRQLESQPIGFSLIRAAAEKSRMQLVAAVTVEVLEKSVQELVKADALILEITKADDIAALEKAVKVKDSPVAGGRLKTSSAGTLKKALSSGCDFMVFSSEAPTSITKDEKLGKVLAIEIGLGDTLLRTVGDLPIDAVIALEKEVDDTLTVNRLMNLQRLLYLIKKPLLVTVPLAFAAEELQALCDLGVSGVVTEVADARAAARLADLRQAIDKLKKPAPRKKDRMSAILPRLQAEAPQIEEDEEEDV
jgi:hypothetical protein